MKMQRLAIAAVVLATLVVLLVVLAQKREQSSRSVLVERVGELPDIAGEKLTEIKITSPKNGVVVLSKQDDSWRVTVPLDSDVDTSAVDSLVEKLDGLETSGIAASNPENHELLGVTEAKAVQVEAKAGSEAVAHLLVGEYRGGATMVRLAGEDAVVSVRGSLTYAFDKPVKNWRRRQVTNIETDNVEKAVFVNGKRTYTFLNKGERKWERDPSEKTIKDLASSSVRLFVQSIANLRAVDFAEPELTLEAAGIGPEAPSVTLAYREKVEKPETEDAGKAEEKAEGEAEEEQPAEPELGPLLTTVLRLGKETKGGSGNFYVARDGDPVIYTIAKYTSERFAPTDDKFVEKEAPPTPPSAGMGLGGPVGGQPQIDPAMMAKIRQQMAAQGLGQ